MEISLRNKYFSTENSNTFGCNFDTNFEQKGPRMTDLIKRLIVISVEHSKTQERGVSPSKLGKKFQNVMID